jgi:FkbM family methyltransferase
MTFISYAQNFEDVMLWRALGHINQGFYIDIGAQDPVIDSVSLAFYEHGWRGVHIEPTQQYSNKLREARPDEIVEQVAIGSCESLMTFYEISGTGLSTADPVIAKRHELAGYHANQIEVPVISLDVMLDKYKHNTVHWLKLDVEGLEQDVLESWKESVCRPWLLIIESTKPLTQEQSYAQWEPLVFAKDYRYAYFDGLNRYYVHSDHADLLASFNTPPNIFDEFVLSGTASQSFCRLILDKAQQADLREEQTKVRAEQAEANAEQSLLNAQQALLNAQQALAIAHKAQADAQQAEANARQSQADAQQAEIRAQQSAVMLDALHNSSSWRLTAPLRKLSHMRDK